MDEFTDIEALTRALVASSSRKWHSRRSAEVLVDANEMIIGEVSKAIGDGYHATAAGKHLGRYLTEEAAKRAVERNA